MKKNRLIKRLGASLISGAFVIIFSGSVGAAINMPAAKNQITALKSKVLVNSSEIKADCLIKREASAELRENLAAIQLGHIPDPLGELVIDKTEIMRKLGDLAARLIIPEQITIRRDGSILKGSDVIDRISSICKESGEDDLAIDLSRIPTNIVLPGTLQSWKIDTNSENTLGMRLFVLTAQTEGGPFRNLIQVRVSRVVEAAELIRLAKPGETISNSMIRKKKIEVKSDHSNIPVTYAQAVGKCLGRFKSPGTILRSSDLSNSMCNSSIVRAGTRDAWLIKPGENVDFHFNSGTLSLKIPAKAVQGGSQGDEITLINLQNQRRIRGIIKEKGRAEYAQN